MKWNKEISLLKTVATVLVVLGHSITEEYRYGILGVVWTIIYSFHMFLFFAISGYLFQGNIKKYTTSKVQFCVKKFKQLMVPYIVITALVYGILFVSNGFPTLYSLLGKPELTKMGFINALILNKNHYDTHLWYVYRLFFVFVINIVFVNSTKSIPFFLSCCVLNCVPNITAECMPYVAGLIKWMIPFWIGRAFADRNKELTYSKRKIIAYGLAFIICVLMSSYLGNLTILNYYIGMTRRGIVQCLWILTGLLGSYLLFAFCKRFSSVISKFLSRINGYTYDIYLLHQPFIVVGTVKIFSKLKFGTISIFIATIVGVIIPVLVSKYILRKHAITRKLILGQE